MTESEATAGPDRSSAARVGFVDRWVSIAAAPTLVLAALETTLLLARVRGARSLLTALLVLAASAGAVSFASLASSALVAVRAPAGRAARWVVGGAGAVLAALALHFDARAYVRLYGLQHAALGVVGVLGCVLLSAALPRRPVRTRARLAVLLAAIALAPLAMNVRHDARAYAAQRGVLLADAFWLTHRDADALPALPARPTIPPSEPSPLATRPPLILLVTVDALRADAADAPAFRGFATVRANAVDFTAARAPAAWTVPSVYALLTSRGPWHVAWTRAQFFGDRPVPYDGPSRNPRRVWPLPLRDSAETLATALHGAGYRTATCATLPFFVPGGGVTRGFDRVDVGVYAQRNRDLRGTTSDLLTACGLAMLDEAHGQPLFLWLHYSDPHEPYLRHPDVPVPNESPEARYAGEVGFVDEHLRGLLLNVQRRVGLQNVLVVLTADHGEEFGEHGGEFHAVTLYEEVEHVPLFIAATGIAPRRVTDSVSLLDVAPTILDLAGAPPLASADGRSLAAAMRGAPLAPRPVFAESIRYGRAVRSVIDGQYKLIYEARARTYELFDLAHDPREDTVVTDEHLDVARRFAREMGVPSP